MKNLKNDVEEMTENFNNQATTVEQKKNVIFVVLTEKDVNGSNRVIYAHSVEETPNMLIVKHAKKDGTPCTSKFPAPFGQKIEKIYSEDK